MPVLGGGSASLSTVGFSSSGLLSGMSRTFFLGWFLTNRGRRRPRFRNEASDDQAIAANQRSYNDEPAACKATEHAWTRPFRGGSTRPMGERQRLQATDGKARIRLASHTENPQCGHRNGQPQPLSTGGIHHFRLMPLPSPAFGIFEAAFNPTAHAIPHDVRLFRCPHPSRPATRLRSLHPSEPASYSTSDFSLR